MGGGKEEGWEGRSASVDLLTQLSQTRTQLIGHSSGGTSIFALLSSPASVVSPLPLPFF